MTRRILPPDEWFKLAKTDLGAKLLLCDPQTTIVLVVEDGQEIVGQWALFTHRLHVDGIGIDTAYQGKTAVQRHLWVGMRDIIQAFGGTGAYTHANDPHTMMLLERAGATVLEGQAYVLPFVKETTCQP